MKNAEKALKILENSWSREKILTLLQKGIGADSIVDDFFFNNNEEIIEFISNVSYKEKEIMKQIEELLICELRLLNKINNYNYFNNNTFTQKKGIRNYKFKKNNLLISKLSFFINRWSNTFVVAVLIAISALALTKQAWA